MRALTHQRREYSSHSSVYRAHIDLCCRCSKSHPSSDFSTPVSEKTRTYAMGGAASTSKNDQDQMAQRDPVTFTDHAKTVWVDFFSMIPLFLKKPDAYNDTMRAIKELIAGRGKGIGSVTREQFLAAEQRIQYDPAKFHFAVCGTSGSGKSSLINAFRGLTPAAQDAAKVGVTECTTAVTRYPDPHNEIPYSRFVWYDIPGAGTLNVTDLQYFNNQGLFVFDFIVIVYDVRFTKIDAGIIKSCLLFKIPFFVVRSKADQHIQNMMNDTGEYDRQIIVGDYVKATRSDFDANLEEMVEALELDEGSRQLLLNQQVYIVSGSTLRGLFQTSEEKIQQSRIIDEHLLIDGMLRQVARRRYSRQATIPSCGST